MRELHAGVLFLQGLPIVVIVLLAIWIAYHVRVAVAELRAIRAYLEWFADREEGEEKSPNAE